jgi:hypothetical protein
MPVVVVEASELSELVRAAVAEELGTLTASVTRIAAPSLLDRRGLAEALAISPAALDRLRAEAGFPELRIGDAPRFEVARVLEWLRARSEAPALRVAGGAK